MLRLRFIAMAALAVFLNASVFAGTTYAVGTCLPNLPFYPTISQAVSSVPSGSTIKVCPGSYPEQVLITQPLTLEGVPNGSGGAVVVAPTGGLTQTATSNDLGTIACQILVQSTGPVNITNLAVDGTGASIAAPNALYIGGIVYEDSAGTVSYVSARNQTYEGYGGIGISALTTASAAQTVTIEDSFVRGFDGIGIYASTGSGEMTVNSKTNTIHGTGSNAEGFLINAANGTVQNNAISGITQGIYLELSGATIATNTISATAIGLYIVGGSNNVTNNRIDAGGFLGVYLTNSATNSVVEKNTIGNAETAVTGCGGLGGTPPPPASGFTVTGNIITDAATGTEMPSGNTSAPNKFYATSMAVQACH
jgi:parallel beta-helix repeat protein